MNTTTAVSNTRNLRSTLTMLCLFCAVAQYSFAQKPITTHEWIDNSFTTFVPCMDEEILALDRYQIILHEDYSKDKCERYRLTMVWPSVNSKVIGLTSGKVYQSPQTLQTTTTVCDGCKLTYTFTLNGFIVGHGLVIRWHRLIQIEYNWCEGTYVTRNNTETFNCHDNQTPKESGYISIIPRENVLEQNYPNPFNPSTTITYSLVDESPVVLKVFNSLGMEVATLVNERKSAGTHSVAFNAENLVSGVYTYTLTVAGQTLSRKMVLVK